MQENKLVYLSFEFAKSIVNLADNINIPKRRKTMRKYSQTFDCIMFNS